MPEHVEITGVGAANDLKIVVVHDNNPNARGFSATWGFSAYISGAPKSILFDTGPIDVPLLDNMQRLNTDPQSIDVVVLSHIHPDHTGGLDTVLRNNPQAAVYIPKSFPTTLKQKILQYGVITTEVKGPLEICEGIYSTGELGLLVKEQSLAVRTPKGLIIMVGCAHPGIVNIVARVRELFRQRILLLMGGFHLEWSSRRKIEKVISCLEQSGVQYVAPCHCTGEKARRLLQEHAPDRYIDIGTGRVITVSDLYQ